MDNIKVVASREEVVAIADAIREKTGTTEGMTYTEMVEAIGTIDTKLPEQSKTVTAGVSTTTVTPDAGHVLNKVTVNPTPSQSKTVTPVPEGVTVTPDVGMLLSQVILNGFELPSPEGQYVWKKCEVIPPITVDLSKVTITASRVSNTLNHTIIKFTTSDFDITSLSKDCYIDFFNGLTCGSGALSFGVDDVGNLCVSETPKYMFLWNSAEATLTMTSTRLGDEYFAGRVTVKSGSNVRTVKNSERVFVNFITSDDPNAYPDGAVQDGYWYERVIEGIPVDKCITPETFGCTKIAIDKFTYSSDVNSSSGSCTLNHSLNEIPKVVICATDYNSSGTGGVTTDYIIQFAGFIYISSVGKLATRTLTLIRRANSGKDYGTHTNMGIATPTASSLTFASYSTNYYFIKGKEYTLITMA